MNSLNTTNYSKYDEETIKKIVQKAKELYIHLQKNTTVYEWNKANSFHEKILERQDGVSYALIDKVNKGKKISPKKKTIFIFKLSETVNDIYYQFQTLSYLDEEEYSSKVCAYIALDWYKQGCPELI